jgi:cell division protein FtsN
MVATWWVLTGSASPTLTAEEPVAAAPKAPSKTQQKTFYPQPILTKPKPDILISEGDAAPLQTDRQLHQPSPTDSGFSIQMGAFKQKEGAQRRLKELERQGYEARIISHEQEGSSIFRVIAGDFRTREEAIQAAKDLKGAGVEAFVRTTEAE